MWIELEKLLARVEGGTASAADLARFGELLATVEAAEPLPLGAALRGEAGLSEVDRHVVDGIGAGATLRPTDAMVDAVRAEAGGVDVTAEVLAHILEDLPLADAVRAELGGELPIGDAIAAEAGRVDLAGDIFAALGIGAKPAPVREAVVEEAGEPVDLAMAFDVPLREALLAEAGTVEVAAAVMAALNIADDLPILDAVQAEAGTVDLVAAVMAALNVADDLPILDAVQAEAGTVDVADAVMAAVAPVKAKPAMPSALPAELPSTPAPANSTGWTRNGFAWGAVALAAIALFAVLLGRVVLVQGWSPDAPPPTAAIDRLVPTVPFASANEIQIDDLEYDDNVSIQLIHDENSDNSPTIIWVDEEPSL